MNQKIKEKARHRRRPQQILTDAEVVEIRSTYHKGQHGSGLDTLAFRFGCSPSHIRRIVRREARKDVA